LHGGRACSRIQSGYKHRVAHRDTPYRYYHAGELFSLKHLAGNLELARAISNESAGRYSAILPQDLEADLAQAKAIRDADLLALLGADVALFHFDGAELDSGTIVEFMVAKFADVPSVLLRTDFRRGGDGHRDPWNLMVSDWPRTEKVLVHSMGLYRRARAERGDGAVDAVTRAVARQVIDAFDRVLRAPPVLPAELREAAYDWLCLAPGFGLAPEKARARVRAILEVKLRRKLL
jgi:nucleoside 2-deoxyribosyltransferase